MGGEGEIRRAAPWCIGQALSLGRRGTRDWEARSTMTGRSQLVGCRRDGMGMTERETDAARYVQYSRA